MHPVDRFQALIRHDDYCNDPRLQLRSKFRTEAWYQDFIVQGKALIRYKELYGPWRDAWWRGKCIYECFLYVWGLNYAVDPKNPQDVAEALKALHAKDVSIFTGNLQGLDPRAEFVSPHLVTLSFDPYQSPGKQGKQALKILGAKMKQLKRTAPREKQRGLDPWDVWDKHKVHGETLSDIARDLLPVLGKPASNERGNTAAKLALDHVAWAFDKAQAMIEEVSRRRNPDPASLATGMAKLQYYVEHEGMEKHVFALFERARAVL